MPKEEAETPWYRKRGNVLLLGVMVAVAIYIVLSYVYAPAAPPPAVPVVTNP